jgi:hypothetical protein
MNPNKPKLGDQRWEALVPKIDAVAVSTETAIQGWAEIAAEAVNGDQHADWRWLLADLRERCWESGRPCPYQLTYLVQLAETYQAVKGDFDRGVTTSVLIEGRNLSDLLDVVKPGMTVGRMKAIVFKRNTQDSRSVEEIQAEQKRHRVDGRERSKRRQHAEKIAGWPLSKAEDLLALLAEEAAAYRKAVARLDSEGAEWDSGDLVVAMQEARMLVSALEVITPRLSEAA